MFTSTPHTLYRHPWQLFPYQAGFGPNANEPETLWSRLAQLSTPGSASFDAGMAQARMPLHLAMAEARSPFSQAWKELGMAMRPSPYQQNPETGNWEF